MAKSDDIKKFQDVEAAWKVQTANLAEEPRLYETLSGIPVERTYTPSHLTATDPVEDISLPGKYPFTRGIHATGYRGKLWTMRMFAGFGTPEETNKRFHFLLENGETGLSTAFDSGSNARATMIFFSSSIASSMRTRSCRLSNFSAAFSVNSWMS